MTSVWVEVVTVVFIGIVALSTLWKVAHPAQTDRSNLREVLIELQSAARLADRDRLQLERLLIQLERLIIAGERAELTREQVADELTTREAKLDAALEKVAVDLAERQRSVDEASGGVATEPEEPED